MNIIQNTLFISKSAAPDKDSNQLELLLENVIRNRDEHSSGKDEDAAFTTCPECGSSGFVYACHVRCSHCGFAPSCDD